MSVDKALTSPGPHHSATRARRPTVEASPPNRSSAVYHAAVIQRPIGFEAQYSLVLSPRHLHLDGRAKRLASLELPRDLEPPRSFHWSADAVSEATVLRGPLTAAQQPWVVSDLDRRFRDAPAYRHSPALSNSEVGVWQLEVATEPLPPDFSNECFVERCTALYETSLRGLLERGIAGPFPGSKASQMGIREQINIELWRSGDAAPLWRQLGHLGLGLAVQLAQPPPEDPALAILHENLRKKIGKTARNRVFCDIFSNGWRLVHASLQGRLRPRTLQRWMSRRGVIALLAACFDHSYCHWYVHGFVPLSPDDLLKAADELPLLRKLECFTPIPETLTGVPFPPDDPGWRAAHNLAFHRASLGDFTDLGRLERAARAAFYGEPSTESGLVRLPLFHPRKSWTPGRAWIELRHVHDLKLRRLPSWPYRSRVFHLSGERRVSVHEIGHLLALGRDIQRFLHIALETGRHLDLLQPKSWSETAASIRSDHA